MAKAKCKIRSCKELHHAKGYCNRHYKKFMKYNNPLEGKFMAPFTKEPQRKEPAPKTLLPEEPKIQRTSGREENLQFFLNQKFIDKLFNEILKAFKDPLYKNNQSFIDQMLSLAARMAGFSHSSKYILNEYILELRTWAENGDKIRFHAALANWKDIIKDFEPQRTEQLSFLDNHRKKLHAK